MGSRNKFNRFISFLPSLALVVLLFVLTFLTRFKPRKELVPKNGAIVYWSHTNIYLQQIDPLFSHSSFPMTYLGDHSILSYTWASWHWLKNFYIFRFEVPSDTKPFEQIKSYLDKNPELNFGIMTDSGGPYLKVRPSLVTLAIATNRPLVAIRTKISRCIKIRQHKIPIPFACLESEFSRAVEPSELKDMKPEQAIEMLEQLFK